MPAQTLIGQTFFWLHNHFLSEKIGVIGFKPATYHRSLETFMQPQDGVKPKSFEAVRNNGKPLCNALGRCISGEASIYLEYETPYSYRVPWWIHYNLIIIEAEIQSTIIRYYDSNTLTDKMHFGRLLNF